MSGRRQELWLVLYVRSPFLFRGLEGKLVGVDVAHLKNERSLPIIPSDQVRGVIREALEELHAANVTGIDIEGWFGRGSGDKPGEYRTNDPYRGRLLFSDLTASAIQLDPDGDSEELTFDNASQMAQLAWSKSSDKGRETTRIRIDDQLGAAEAGMLQVLELVAPFGAAVRFQGFAAFYGDDDEAERLEDLITKALNLVSSIGAFKSPGFGEVLHSRSKIKVEKQGERTKASPGTSKPLSAGNERWRLRVTFDRPIVVDTQIIAQNARRGGTVVPGAVFKGALAQTLKFEGENPEAEVLGDALSGLSFSPAFPEEHNEDDTGKRSGRWSGLPVPLSVVSAKVHDAVVFGDALNVGYGKGAVIQGEAAVFQSDWKDSTLEKWLALAQANFGLPKYEEPPPIPRTHTAIDRRSGTARDQFLFTTIARSVEHQGAAAKRAWLLDLDVGGIGDTIIKEKAIELADRLVKNGLDFIGKTDARATFEPLDSPRAEIVFSKARAIDRTPGVYAIVLATSAVLLDAAALVDGRGWKVTPQAAYESYWNNYLSNKLKAQFRLESFYAAQEYRGGYLARRRRLYGKTYFPFLLTKAGSVFKVACDDPAAVDRLVRFGLPVPEFAHPDTGASIAVDWRNCPFVPENGYGWVTADHLSWPNGSELLEAVDAV